MTQYIWVFLIGLVYMVLTLTNPIAASSQTLSLTEVQIRLLQLTILGPYIVSWISGVVGYEELRSYASHLRVEEQKNAFNKLAVGIITLVSTSIVTAFVGIFRARITLSNPEFLPFVTILTNYLYIFPPMIGLWIIYDSLRSLTRSINAPAVSGAIIGLGWLFALAVSALNIWLTFTNTTRQFGSSPESQASYYLSDNLILLTILLPSAITWIIGVMAVLSAQNYRQHVVGTVFQSAISKFTQGMLAVLVSSVFLQLLLALGSTRLLAFGLTGILGLVYVFVVLQTTGYVLIGLSSRKLALVEQILSKYTSKQNHDDQK